MPGLRSLSVYVTGSFVVARAAWRLFRRLSVNTAERIFSPMTAPAGLTETIEALDGGMEVAVRLRHAIAETGPGGKKVTLDEMLHTVSDGEVKDTIRNLYAAVEQLIQNRGGNFSAILDLIPTLVEAVLDFLQTLRVALQDRRVTPDEILAGVSTKGMRPALQKAIDGADKIPAELKGLDFGKMMQLMNRVMGWLPQLLADPA